MIPAYRVENDKQHVENASSWRFLSTKNLARPLSGRRSENERAENNRDRNRKLSQLRRQRVMTATSAECRDPDASGEDRPTRRMEHSRRRNHAEDSKKREDRKGDEDVRFEIIGACALIVGRRGSTLHSANREENCAEHPGEREEQEDVQKRRDPEHVH